MSRTWSTGPLVFLLCVAGQASAQDCLSPAGVSSFFEPTFPHGAGSGEPAPCSSLRKRDPFAAGMWNVQFASGGEGKTGGGSPAFDYLPQSLRAGYILNTPSDCDGWCRGAWEVILEYNFSPVGSGPVSHFTGPGVLARYNFVQPACLLVPFVQGGAGVAFLDSDGTAGPNHLGDDTQFRVRADVGARYMLTEWCSLDASVGYQHFSNAGINAVGGTLGFTWFFGGPP